ncbi:MAG: FAD-dependent oxidoreductase [Verrucomicrobia bacterium]|nr:FAD-dependent oxidoreductase [Verrucomicrobiota bacterium]
MRNKPINTWIVSNVLAATALCALAGASPTAQVVAQIRDIPVLYETDVVVAGGSSAAVAAACAAAQRGAQVVLIAPRPYLGDDLCGQQHLWLEAGESPESELARSLFPNGRVTTPLTVKNALDAALLKHGVRFLTGCMATDLLVDEHKRPCGVVMVNRSGSQAITAKVVIDATSHAVLARQVAKFRPFVPGEREFHFVVVGGALQSRPGLVGHTLDVVYKNPASKKPGSQVHEYVVKLPMRDASFAAYARAEQTVRDAVSGAEMRDCSEYAFWIPGDTMIGSVARLHVLSAFADVSAEGRKQTMPPLAWLAVGEAIGSSAASEVKKLSHASDVRLAEVPVKSAAAVGIGEPRNVTILPATAGVVKAGSRALPLLGQYDVVVIGGGTAGAPAAIAAARSGAKTLVVEYLDELGGVGTAGLIGSYWYGNRVGFTKEAEDAISGTNRWSRTQSAGWSVVQKSEWLRRELLKAKADIWFGCFGCGAVVDKGRVTGVVVATPFGRGVVLAKTTVDATGNADIADCAGAETQFGVAPGGMLSVQLAGYPHRNLGDNANNTCFALVDDTSVLDIAHLMAWCRAQMSKAKHYDAGQLLDSRERRRIVADYMLTTPDILNRRTFPDTISHHNSNFDAAAFPTSPMLLVKDMKGPAFDVDLPYRSLLPKGLDGILVTGLGAGTERDAMTLVRMQADLQNQGYAAGLAAAMAATHDSHTRDIAIKQLQKQLVDKGALAARVLTDKDSCPMSPEAIAQAVADVGTMTSGIKQQRTVEDPSIFSLAVVMAHSAQAMPLLRQAHDDATNAGRKLTYAKILGVLRERAAASTLIAAVAGAVNWDKGYGLTWHRESDNTFSELDRAIIALGLSGAPEGLEAIVNKVRQLKPESELSHFIAVAMALQQFKRPRVAIQPLTRLLSESGFTGHAMIEPVDSQRAPTPRDVATSKPDTSLNAAFKELLVAGMLVHCGDTGRGREILEQYSRGVEGQFARYARHMLGR